MSLLVFVFWGRGVSGSDFDVFIVVSVGSSEVTFNPWPGTMMLA